jgi:hypothetical protein
VHTKNLYYLKKKSCSVVTNTSSLFVNRVRLHSIILHFSPPRIVKSNHCPAPLTHPAPIEPIPYSTSDLATRACPAATRRSGGRARPCPPPPVLQGDGNDHRLDMMETTSDYLSRTSPGRQTGSPAESQWTAAGQRRRARLTLHVPASSVLLSLFRPCLPSRSPFCAPRQQVPIGSPCAGVVFQHLVRAETVRAGSII